MKTKVLMVLMVSIILFSAGQVQAGIVDSNSITKDGIEYYLQTDKSVYTLGENVLMLYRVTNIGDEDVTFETGNTPQYQFKVQQDETIIWFCPGFFFPSVTRFTLHPGELKEYSNYWDMINFFTGDLVSPGNYDITGALYDLALDYRERYVPVTVPIEIVPEPATILLLSAGILGIRIRKPRRLH